MLSQALLSTTLLLSASASQAADDPELSPRLFLHIRPEVRTNPSFIADQDDTMMAVQQAARVGLDARRGVVSGRADLLGTQSWGARAGSTSAEPTAFLYESWVQVGSKSTWLRAGRQELHLLNGLYMSKAPWNPVGRTFDGLRVHHETDSVRLDAFSVVLRAPHPADDDWDNSTLGTTHAGVFASWLGGDALEPTVFMLARADGPTADDPNQSKWWVAPATRLLYKADRTTLDAHAMVQIGDDTGTPIRAWNTIVRARQGLGSGELAPGIGLIFEQDSGHACDGDPASLECNSDVIRDMDSGFGRNHYLRGNADQFNASNMRDMGLELDSSPWTPDKAHRLTLALQGHLFQLVDPQGAWRRNGGTLQGAGWEPGNTDPNVAFEVDALMDWKLGPGVRIDGGLCVVQPTGVGARLTGDDAMVYAFARNRFTF